MKFVHLFTSVISTLPYCELVAANRRSHIEPGKSLIVILAEVIQSGLPTCPNNLQSAYQSGMSDFRDIVKFRASAELSEIVGLV